MLGVIRTWDAAAVVKTEEHLIKQIRGKRDWIGWVRMPVGVSGNAADGSSRNAYSGQFPIHTERYSFNDVCRRVDTPKRTWRNLY